MLALSTKLCLPVMLSLLLMAAWSAPACARQDAAEPGSANEPQALRDEQARLLDKAYEVASSYPLVPHIKNRSRAQDWVAEAAIELGMYKTARRYADGVANYRRGKLYGLIAAAQVRAGDEAGAKPNLDLAWDIAKAQGLEDWERGWVLASIAYVHALKGEYEEAHKLLSSDFVAGSGANELISKALAERPAPFEPRMKQFAELVSKGEFDQTRLVMWGYAEEFKRHYEDPAKRERVLIAFDAAAKTMPGHVRVPMLLEMIDHVLDQAKPDHEAIALGLLKRTEQVLDGANLPLIYLVPMKAELSGLRYRAGEKDAARAELSGLVEAYEAGKDGLENYQHAEAVRPIAEAYVVMGDLDAARGFYRRAFELGLVNPNLRPRIRDFTMNCVSLALSGIEPGDKLWPAIHQAHQDILKRD